MKAINQSAARLYRCAQSQNQTILPQECFCGGYDESVQCGSAAGYLNWSTCTDADGFITSECPVSEIESCAPGYRGFLCGECVDPATSIDMVQDPNMLGKRFYRAGNDCKVCSEFAAMVVWVSIAVIGIGVIFSVLINQKIAGMKVNEEKERVMQEKMLEEMGKGNDISDQVDEAKAEHKAARTQRAAVVVMLKVLSSHFQFLAIVSDFPLAFPEWIMSFFSSLTSIAGSGSVSAFGPDCFIYNQAHPEKLTSVWVLLASKHYIITGATMVMPFVIMVLVGLAWIFTLGTVRCREGRGPIRCVIGIGLTIWHGAVRHILCCRCWRAKGYPCACTSGILYVCGSIRFKLDTKKVTLDRQLSRYVKRQTKEMDNRHKTRMEWMKNLKELDNIANKEEQARKANVIQSLFVKQRQIYPEDYLCCEYRNFDRSRSNGKVSLPSARPALLCFNHFDSSKCVQRFTLSMVVIFFMLLSQLIKSVLSLSSCSSVQLYAAEGILNSTHQSLLVDMGFTSAESHPPNIASQTAGYTRFQTQRLIDDPAQVCWQGAHQMAIIVLFAPFLALYVGAVPFLMIESTRRFKGKRVPFKDAIIRSVYCVFYTCCKKDKSNEQIYNLCDRATWNPLCIGCFSWECC